MTAEELLDSLGLGDPPNSKESRRQFCERFDTQLNLTGVVHVWTPKSQHGVVLEAFVLETEKTIPCPPDADYPRGCYKYMHLPTAGAVIPADEVRRFAGVRRVFPAPPPQLTADDLSAFARKLSAARRENMDLPTWLVPIMLDAERSCDSVAHHLRDLKRESLPCSSTPST
jgi:hypothetical protein